MTPTHILILGSGQIDVAFAMPDDPLQAAELALHLADELTGNSLGYPHIESYSFDEENEDV